MIAVSVAFDGWGGRAWCCAGAVLTFMAPRGTMPGGVYQGRGWGMWSPWLVWRVVMVAVSGGCWGGRARCRPAMPRFLAL